MPFNPDQLVFSPMLYPQKFSKSSTTTLENVGRAASKCQALSFTSTGKLCWITSFLLKNIRCVYSFEFIKFKCKI